VPIRKGILTNNGVLVLSIVFVPVLGSFILPLAGMLSEKLRNWLSFIFISISFLFSMLLLPQVISGNIITIQKTFQLGLNFTLVADNLAVFMALASSFISAMIVLYSFDYVSHYENRNEYYTMVTLFLGAMMGIVFSSNLILLFLFWEITGIVSWRLIGFFRARSDVLMADKAFLVTVFGALLMLIGFISLYHDTGSFDLLTIKEALKHGSISNITIALILAGIFSKSATLPFQTWLPDAGVAPSPVTALLHAAVLVKIGVYVFARIFVATLPLPVIWQTIIPAIAAASAIISAGAAMIDTNIKRIIAYSTISQIGFIFFGLACGNIVGVAGALLYILMHGIAKAGLFLCAGIVEQATHEKNIKHLGGLITTMPYTAAAFLMCSLSVMGVPPFGGFFSKYMVFMGGINSGQFINSGFFMFGAFLTIIYLFRVFKLVFLGDVKIKANEGSAVMVGTVFAMGVISLIAGILIMYPARFAEITAIQMMGLIK
jgi:NADH:ubiquinone oxidoreductase subunit 5 (subunit L)/multisubunit Na+/H+ antiporter MnhA subunit